MEYKLSQAIVADLSVDLCQSTVQADLMKVNWVEPARFIVFEVGEPGDRIEVDSRVLEARCPHFVRALRSGMQESLPNTPFCLQDVSKPAMQQFTNYLYADTFDPQALDQSVATVTVQLSQLLEDSKVGIRCDNSACITKIRPEVSALGWKEGDQIVAVNGREVTDKDSFRDATEKAKNTDMPIVFSLER